jgi:ZIP family zinc transporter
MGLAFLAGAITFFGVDWLIDRRGGADRKDIEGKQVGSGSAIFIGTLLDNIPESIVLGMGMALGGAINTAFLVAVFISNLPEGVAGSLNLEAAGRSRRSIFWMWMVLVIISAACAGLGYVIVNRLPGADGRLTQSFADHAGRCNDAGGLRARWKAGRPHHSDGFFDGGSIDFRLSLEINPRQVIK